MDPVLKAKWVAALRSGKHEQGHNQMIDQNGGMCCLAVLRHVVDPEDRCSRNNANQMPTHELLAEVGLAEDDAINLATRNDGNGGYHQHTFIEIADHIEAHL